MLNKIPGESQTHLSINTVCNPDEAINYPTEFLNSISVPGLSPHKLEFKIGVPFILLRNFKLCNGTRLRVVSLQKKVIEGRIISGCGKGNRDYTGMWVRRGSTSLMAGKVVFLRGLLSPIRVVDLTILGDVQTTTPEGECTM
ncbi:ATP-dependent DNA helicase [Trichonephila clavipes]|nr:ATP-dependent DNA helicase [Trichonephila clavipes]